MNKKYYGPVRHHFSGGNSITYEVYLSEPTILGRVFGWGKDAIRVCYPSDRVSNPFISVYHKGAEVFRQYWTKLAGDESMLDVCCGNNKEARSELSFVNTFVYRSLL